MVMITRKQMNTTTKPLNQNKMTAKLIKAGNHYDLYYRIAEENLIVGFASTDNTFDKKLYLKKCQEIEQQFPTQRMWDVDVEMDAIPWDGFPKLDSDGYLILKII